jgi:hypothetical protein
LPRKASLWINKYVVMVKNAATMTLQLNSLQRTGKMLSKQSCSPQGGMDRQGNPQCGKT